MGGLAGGKGGAPAPPDFSKIAQTPTSTPWAQQTFGTGGGGAPRTIMHGGEQIDLPGGGGSGSPGQHIGLSPQLDQANQSMMGQLANSWATPLDNGAQARQHAQDAIYGQETSRLDPQWQQRQHDFETQMANQGIDPNSQAYATASGNLNRAQNDAYQQANYGSIVGGGQEGQRQQQMDLASRGAPLSGMQGLMGLSGQPQNQLLQAAMAQYQGGLQSYGMDQQGKNSALGGLMGLGGSLGGASILGSAMGKKNG